MSKEYMKNNGTFNKEEFLQSDPDGKVPKISLRLAGMAIALIGLTIAGLILLFGGRGCF